MPLSPSAELWQGDVSPKPVARARPTCSSIYHGTSLVTGSASRSDRVAKYNQLLRIEEELGSDAVYGPGSKRRG